MAMKYGAKGAASTSKSQFMKTPDTFRTSIEQQDYDKTGKTGKLSKPAGDTKKKPAIKPRT